VISKDASSDRTQPQSVEAIAGRITRGLLDRIAQRAELEGFVPHEPYRAGCVVDVAIPAGP
jgi:hypothetical protein